MNEIPKSAAWEKAMCKAFDVLQPLSKPKLGPPVFGTPASGHIFCGRCRKPMPLERLRYYNTGVCVASDGVCEECAKLVPKHALVVCVGCKAVVARMAPGRMKSGFEIVSRRIYHVQECPNCNPDITSSKIIEAELFYLKSK